MLSEISKRVQKAVEKANKAKDKHKKDYNTLAYELEDIANEFNLHVDFLRKVSCIEYKSIKTVLKYHSLGMEEEFKERYDALFEYDKKRVDKIIKNLSIVGE